MIKGRNLKKRFLYAIHLTVQVQTFSIKQTFFKLLTLDLYAKQFLINVVWLEIENHMWKTCERTLHSWVKMQWCRRGRRGLHHKNTAPATAKG